MLPLRLITNQPDMISKGVSKAKSYEVTSFVYVEVQASAMILIKDTDIAVFLLPKSVDRKLL